jgi:hypothetical protein
VRKPIVIGRRVFATKKEATEACRAVLYRHPVGHTFLGEDERFLADLILLHAEAEQKIGVGVRSFQVEQNGPTRGFWITRIDGSRTDFSFIACLTPRTPEREALDAMRWAIRDQVVAFRAAKLNPSGNVCEVTGTPITPADAHVDHEPPFRVLVADFLAQWSVALADVRVMPTADRETVTVLADASLRVAWQEYHRANAGLRLVSREANLSLLRRGVAR